MKNLKHGMSYTSIYKIWRGMKSRCQKNAVKSIRDVYFNKGITVCPRWFKFENFYADMGERPEGMEIDRIDNEKGYMPSNCRWVTGSHNAANKLIKNKSGLPRGVEKTGHRYRARLSINSKMVLIGTYKTIKEAEQAHIRAFMALYSELPPEYRRKVL